MKPTQASSTQRATPAGPRSIFTASASSTSALPHALDAARFPCFATRPPAAATTRELTVEMLKLFERSPPVPTISIASPPTMTRTAASRSAVAKPAISSTLSPRTCSAARSAPSCAGVASPAITEAIAERASWRASVRPPATIPRASRASTEVLQHAHSVRGHHRLRVELHGFERKCAMAKRHHDAIVASRGDHELRGKALLVDHERVVARRLGRIGDSGEDAAPVMPNERRLAMARLRCAHHARSEGDRRALQAEAYAERLDATLGRLSHQRRRSAGDLRPPRARRDHEPVGLLVQGRLERGIVRAYHGHLGAERPEGLGQVVGERVVVIDQQHLRHGRASPPSTSSIARSSARALARVSNSSAAGSESATMPAPAWIRHTPSAITAVRIAMQVSRRPSNPM